jgi:hypothetical protein
MSGTIDEIQDRLTPSRILHKATASVRDASADSMRRVLSQAGRTAGRTAGQARAASAAAADFARSHPLPAALALSGLALTVVLARAFAGRRRSTASVSGMGVDGMDVHPELQDWAEPSNGARPTTSVTSWIAENSLAVGAAVAAAGTVVGLSRANQRARAEATDTVRR